MRVHESPLTGGCYPRRFIPCPVLIHRAAALLRANVAPYEPDPIRWALSLACVVLIVLSAMDESEALQ